MRKPGSTCKTREQRRESANELAQLRSTRTPQQQIEILDQRLGKDAGAKKERERLTSLIEAAKAPPKKETKSKPDGDRRKTRAKDRRSNQRKKKTSS